MKVIPVVLERALLAGLLGLPPLGLIASVVDRFEGGLFAGGLILAGAVVYTAVVSLLLRKQRRAELDAAEPAPPEAVVEPLAQTALRSGLKALAGLALAWLWGTFSAAAILVGFALYTAVGAVTLQRHERRAGHRLVRVKGEPGRLRAY